MFNRIWYCFDWRGDNSHRLASPQDNDVLIFGLKKVRFSSLQETAENNSFVGTAGPLCESVSNCSIGAQHALCQCENGKFIGWFFETFFFLFWKFNLSNYFFFITGVQTWRVNWENWNNRTSHHPWCHLGLICPDRII